MIKIEKVFLVILVGQSITLLGAPTSPAVPSKNQRVRISQQTSDLPATKVDATPVVHSIDQQSVNIAKSGASIEVASQQEIDTHLKSGKIVLIKVSTEWCGPCKLLKPVYEQVAAQYPDITFLCLDADKHKELAKKLIGSRGYPTLITHNKSGKQVNIQSGIPGSNPESIKNSLVQKIREAKGEIVSFVVKDNATSVPQPVVTRTNGSCPVGNNNGRPIVIQQQSSRVRRVVR